jgi:hypothetical protein
MKQQFNSKQARLVSAAEKALGEWEIDFVAQADGSLLVPGDLDISGKGLESLPDLSNVIVDGDFACHENKLTSLKGAPQKVHRGFYCGLNQLTSLEHAPKKVGGTFMCQGNLLTSLKGGPREVGGGYECANNQLTTLEGAPRKIPGKLGCHNNKLKTLKGAPREVGAEIFLAFNPLECLEGAPLKFRGLVCELGEFAGYKDIPPAMLISQETIDRRIAEKEQAIIVATVLQEPTQVGKPLRFKAISPGR